MGEIWGRCAGDVRETSGRDGREGGAMQRHPDGLVYTGRCREMQGDAGRYRELILTGVYTQGDVGRCREMQGDTGRYRELTLTGVCASAYGGVTEKTCAGARGSKRVRGTEEAPKCSPPSNESVRPTW